MDKCLICRHQKTKIILDKKLTDIFTNSKKSQKKYPRYKCQLSQCLFCNFVYQKTTIFLKKKLSAIYKSQAAQLSQPLGEGNWGQERFNSLKNKLRELKYFKKKTILELGCGNGYILKYLKQKKYLDLCGIDPSINNNYKNYNLNLIKKFVSKNLNLNKSFDLIFSIGFYEHAYNINDITEFSSKHLATNGLILVIVPNVENSLKNGNPDLFAHEHINYFTISTIKKHFLNFDFTVFKNYSDKHTIAIYFKKNKKQSFKYPKKTNVINYLYEKSLNKKLQKILKYTKNNKIIIHGACNSLNNILSWIKDKIDFELVDNDEKKINKYFFGKKVRDVNSLNINNYNLIFIVPTFFAANIKNKYNKLGYKGKYLIIN